MNTEPKTNTAPDLSNTVLAECSISEFLISTLGFVKLDKFKSENIDIDQYSCIKRIGDIHYLFYSDTMKHFDLAIKYEKPKGKAGGGFESYKKIIIPRVIKTQEDAVSLVNAVSPNFRQQVGIYEFCGVIATHLSTERKQSNASNRPEPVSHKAHK